MPVSAVTRAPLKAAHYNITAKGFVDSLLGGDILSGFDRHFMRDFKSAGKPQARPGSKFPRTAHWIVVSMAVAVGFGLFALSSDDARAVKTAEARSAQPRDTQISADFFNTRASRQIELPERTSQEVETTPAPSQSLSWHHLKVKSGDTLAGLFDKAGLSPQQVHELISVGAETKALRQLYPGDKISLALNSDKKLHGIKYELDAVQTLVVDRVEGKLSGKILKKAVEIRRAYASGTINDSLYLAAQKSGLSDNLTMQLAGIFGWDIDFALDIRTGDQFSVIYEEKFLQGSKIGDGRIVAAEFVNQDKAFQAIHYQDPTGRSDHFDPKGRSMRKAFLRSPVDFRRISSKFQRSRWHPVHGKRRPHRGVDYAAKTGTPIKATGDGKIAFKGRKGGYGKTVVIQHGQRYQTLFAHMNGYARGLRRGTRVRQGQTIGYVGRTGVTTGPHLHYEFRVNGVHRNPLTIKLPDAAPLAKKYREDFQGRIKPLIADLGLLRRVQLAFSADQNNK